MFISKDKASAQTFTTELLLLTCLIDATKVWDVAAVDIPGAFMQSDMEGPDTHMKLEGKLVHLSSQLEKNMYEKYIMRENGKPVMYFKFKKHYTVPFRQHSYSGRT